MSSIVPIKWTTKVWLESSKDLLLQALGDASMSSIDSSQRYFLYAQFNSSLSAMLLKLDSQDSQSKEVKSHLIQQPELSLP
jgi:hypothetical protein